MIWPTYKNINFRIFARQMSHERPGKTYSYIHILSDAVLRKYVRHLWVFQRQEIEQTSPVYYATSDTSVKLIFVFKSLGERFEFLHSALHGQSKEFGKYPYPNNVLIIGVHLQPYTSRKLFDLPPAQLLEKIIRLSLIIPQKAELLNEQLSHSRGVEGAINAISTFLKQHLSTYEDKSPSIRSAMEYIVSNHGNVNVSDLASNTFLSVKQFERNFKDFAGLNPKLFSKIVRFESALNNYSKSNSLTDLACSSGYFDQSHFIRDFQAFSGFSPRQYFSISR